MFLLPIVIWWAKEPMRFALGRTRRVLCSMVMCAVAVTATHTTHADERLGRDPSTGASGDPLRSSEPVIHVAPKLIREGTMISPVAGRIAMLGRRWMFIPDRPAADSDDKTANDQPSSRGEFADRSIRFAGDSAKRAASNPFAIDEPRRLMGSVTLVATEDREATGKLDSLPPASEARGADESQGSTQYLLSENLNLQRIVEALRSDPSDDQWILTGEITEFFGENLLTIRTAQRSNHN